MDISYRVVKKKAHVYTATCASVIALEDEGVFRVPCGFSEVAQAESFYLRDSPEIVSFRVAPSVPEKVSSLPDGFYPFILKTNAGKVNNEIDIDLGDYFCALRAQK